MSPESHAKHVPASDVADKQGVGATPKKLNKNALFNLQTPLMIAVVSTYSRVLIMHH